MTSDSRYICMRCCKKKLKWQSHPTSPFCCLHRLWKNNDQLKPLTINKHHRLLDGMLVTELRVQQRSTDKRAVICGLIPADVKMVDVNVTQAPHHLHLVLNWKRWKERENEFISLLWGMIVPAKKIKTLTFPGLFISQSERLPAGASWESVGVRCWEN